MSSLLPSRIPAWLAPVCDDRSVSHSPGRACSATQRAMVRRVAVTDRAPQHRQREAVDLHEQEPGYVGRRPAAGPARDPPGDLSVYASSSSIPVTTPIGVLIADAIRATSSAEPKPSSSSRWGTMSAASISNAASRASTARKPIATVNGIRRAATSGGSTALRIAHDPGDRDRPSKPFSSAPRTRPAASSSASAEPSHAITRRTGRRRALGGSRRARSSRRPVWSRWRRATAAPAARVNHSDSRAKIRDGADRPLEPWSCASP